MSDKNIPLLLQELEKILVKKTDALTEVNLIISFCRKHYSILNDGVYLYINKGIDIALKECRVRESNILKVYKAFYLLHYEKRKEAVDICKSLLHDLRIKKSYIEYGIAISIITQIEWARGNFEEAFRVLDKSVKDLKYKRNQQAALAQIYYSKATLFIDLNEFEEAYHYYSNADQNCNKNTETSLFIDIKIGLAKILKKNRDFKNAIELLNEVLSLSKRNSIWRTEANACHELGEIYLLDKKVQRAGDFLFKSYAIKEKNNAYPALASTMITLAQLNFEERAFEETESYLTKALAICEARSLKSKRAIIFQRLSILAEVQEAYKKSLTYLKKYNLLDKEINANKITVKNKYLRRNHKSENKNKLKKTSRYLNVINAFATGFLETNTVDEIVWMVAREAIGKLGYEDCVVYLFDEKKEFLIQKAAWGPKNPIGFDIHNPIKLKPGLGIVGHVVRSGIGEIISDTTKDNRYITDDQSRQSEITVPIIADGVVIGIIDSEHHQKNFFSPDDLKTLTTIASMTSSRLAQAFALEKLNEHQLVLEKNVKNKTKELHLALNHLQVTNAKLSSSNDEKDILLKEVHHRVKNNLQIITSLLSLQSFNIEDKKTKDLFDNSQYRINAMALIHEMLYQSDNLSKINYADYLKILVNSLLTSFKGIDHKIETLIDITEMYLNIDTAIPLGLLINEIITNSLKYAFNDNSSGFLSLKIHKLEESDNYFMEIGDDGPGISHKIKQAGKKTLGMQLIYKLIKQINGKIIMDKDHKGTNYQIWFKNI